MTGWGKIKQAAAHGGVGPRTLRDWFKLGLPHVRLPSGTILVKFSDVDKFLRGFEVTDDDHKVVDRIVKEVMEDF